MDALNKAEQAKRHSEAVASNADTTASDKTSFPSLTLELTPLVMPEAPPEVAVPPERPPSLPELPAHLGALDDEFIAHATAAKVVPERKPPPPEPRPVIEATPAPEVAPEPAAKPAPVPPRKAEPEEREAAQNLFDAKQAGKPSSRKRVFIAIGVITLLAGMGIGAYVWLQMQPKNGLGAGITLANTPRPPVATTPAAPPPAVAVAAPAPEPAKPQPAAQPAPPVAVEPPADVPSGPTRPIRLSTAKITLNPGLARGYDAFIAGTMDEAQNEYGQVLKTEPSNLDALHGMAAISLRLGRPAAAEEYYLRAIEADPRDALAHAGLIALKGNMDPLHAESRLKTLLATQPDLPYLNFALGNLYASQNRWNEAQSAFFKAYSGEPENPDTLFNLAISLDRLNQTKLALQYYKLALAAAENRAHSFNKSQLSTRMRELQ